MTDERYKQIMKDLGMPNSRSLLGALQQVANETAQEIYASQRYKDSGGYPQLYRDTSAGTKD